MTTPNRWRIAASVNESSFQRVIFIPPADAPKFVPAPEPATDTNVADAPTNPLAADQELLIAEGFALTGATNEQADPLEFSAALAKHEKSVCAEFADQSTYAGIERGFPSAVRLFLCSGRATGGNRITMIKTMRGTHRFYLVAHQLRTDRNIGEANAKAVAELLASWSLHLRGVSMCSHEREGEGNCESLPEELLPENLGATTE